MANLYYYFEQEDLYDRWDKLYSDCLKALEPYEDEVRLYYTLQYSYILSCS